MKKTICQNCPDNFKCLARIVFSSEFDLLYMLVVNRRGEFVSPKKLHYFPEQPELIIVEFRNGNFYCNGFEFNEIENKVKKDILTALDCPFYFEHEVTWK